MKTVSVSAAALFDVLTALNGPAHHILELQVTRGLLVGGDNPINTLFREFNAAVNFAGKPATCDGLAEDHPLWLINSQITGLLEGDGATDDHTDVLEFLRKTGLPESTVTRIHTAICCAEKRSA